MVWMGVWEEWILCTSVMEGRSTLCCASPGGALSLRLSGKQSMLCVSLSNYSGNRESNERCGNTICVSGGSLECLASPRTLAVLTEYCDLTILNVFMGRRDGCMTIKNIINDDGGIYNDIKAPSSTSCGSETHR